MRTNKFITLVCFDKNNFDKFEVVPAANLHGKDVEVFANTLHDHGLKCFTTSTDKGTQKYFSPHIKTGNKLVEKFIQHCTLKGVEINNLFWSM